MNKFLNSFTSVTQYYKLLYKLSSIISDLKISHLIYFIIILILAAFFEITLLGFLYVLLKAFVDPNYYQGNFFFLNFS